MRSVACIADWAERLRTNCRKARHACGSPPIDGGSSAIVSTVDKRWSPCLFIVVTRAHISLLKLQTCILHTYDFGTRQCLAMPASICKNLGNNW